MKSRRDDSRKFDNAHPTFHWLKCGEKRGLAESALWSQKHGGSDGERPARGRTQRRPPRTLERRRPPASSPSPAIIMPAGIKTTPLDPRFPNQNQSQHCWCVGWCLCQRMSVLGGSPDPARCVANRTRYNEYVLCLKNNDNDEDSCKKYYQYAASLCPSTWVRSFVGYGVGCCHGISRLTWNGSVTAGRALGGGARERHVHGRAVPQELGRAARSCVSRTDFLKRTEHAPRLAGITGEGHAAAPLKYQKHSRVRLPERVRCRFFSLLDALFRPLCAWSGVRRSETPGRLRL